MEHVEPTRDLGRIEVDPRQVERWKAGKLPVEWRQRYPFLFDDEDLRLTRTQKSVHFFEWLGAIVLHHSTGFHALVEKYEFLKTHQRKKEIVRRLLPHELLELVCDSQKGAQCPDLLMYAPDLSGWFFCEVKGPNDRIRANQQRVFEHLAAASHKPVRVLHFTLAAA